MAAIDVRDASNARVQLSRKLAAGGEGAIYEIGGAPHLVAKLYHTPAARDRRLKLEAMAGAASNGLRSFTAWPVNCLYGAQGDLVGFTMPRVEAHRDIHLLYSPKSRRSNFPHVDWRFLFHAAINTARAVASIHAEGAVIGDLNPGGVLVAQDATVKLIDCDSFQMTIRGTTYRCDVGVPLFTAPEIQGRDFSTFVRTPNHDNFALSLLIFHLLFLGRHPFAGRYRGAGEMPIEKAIVEHRFAYGARRTLVDMDPPPHTLLLEDLPASLAQLFEAAFSRASAAGGTRPSATEWVRALSTVAPSISRCKAHEGHYFVKESSRCPWCAIERTIGITLFPLPLKSVVAGTVRNLSEAWTAIETIVAPDAGTDIHEPLEVQALVAKANQKSPVPIAVATAVVGGGVVLGIAVKSVWPFIGSLVVAGAVYNGSEQKRSARLQTLAYARQRWQQALSDWHAALDDTPFTAKRQQLKKWYEDAIKLEDRKRDMLLIAGRQRFLEGYFVESAGLQGIGPGRVATLASFGIETAADVEQSALDQVSGFGPVLQSRLIGWRKGLERMYAAMPGKTIDPADHANVESEMMALLTKCIDTLSRGRLDLMEIRQTLQSRRQAARAQIEAEYSQYVNTVRTATQSL